MVDEIATSTPSHAHQTTTHTTSVDVGVCRTTGSIHVDPVPMDLIRPFLQLRRGRPSAPPPSSAPFAHPVRCPFPPDQASVSFLSNPRFHRASFSGLRRVFERENRSEAEERVRINHRRAP